MRSACYAHLILPWQLYRVFDSFYLFRSRVVHGAEAQLEAIQRAATREEWATARQLATTLIQKHPNNAHGWLWMAWLSEDGKSALAYAQRAATLDPAVGNNAVTWVQQQLDPSYTPSRIPNNSIYARKGSRVQRLGRSWLGGMALLVTTGIIALVTMTWHSVIPTVAASASPRYANVPINQDRPFDPLLSQGASSRAANGALAVDFQPTPEPTPEPTATSLPSATPTSAPTPTLIPGDEMFVHGREGIVAIPPPVEPTAGIQPIENRDLLYPVWPYRFEAVVYRVQAGDNISTIAARTGLSAWTIIWANEGSESHPELLTIGQELWIPPMDGVLHIVRQGDTLQGIAAKYKVDAQIIEWFEGNDLRGTGGLLVPGQQIMVPGGVKPITELPPAPAAPTTRGGASYFGWPTTGRITQSYGSYHGGIDIANAMKTPIYASQSGEIVYAGWDNTGYGYMILIDHHNGWRTRYAHLSGMYPAVGDWVNRGDLIALMGSTGNSTGPHLHFEIITRGYRFNPYDYLPR